MHELAITQSIMKIAQQAAQENGVRRVLEIRLKIGDYSGVVPQCVQDYFDIISKGTVAEGAALKLERLPILMRCQRCGWEGQVDKLHICCPQCGGTDLKLLQGREFYVDSLEVE
ncbi:MAG: hydrogenase maturation nickel metallochaperone HypA [Clostridiales bacterium]|nr:hydrogenase maturation nickel metallochaperone HypA [Clostridiales bacterium]